MKIFTSLLCIITLLSCSEKNQFVLNGNIKGIEEDRIALVAFDRSSMSEIGIDTVDVKHGNFRFKRQSLETSNYMLKLVNANVMMVAILENGTIRLSADIKDAKHDYIPKIKLDGGVNQTLFDRFFNMQEEILKQDRYAYCKEMTEKIKATESHDEYVELNEKLNRLAPELENEVKTAQLELLRNNINMYFVAQVFPFIKNLVTIEEFNELYTLLPENIKNEDAIIGMKKDFEAKTRIQPGKAAPDFTLKTHEGTELSLSSLKGKVVLIDFWASWCKPCRESFPHMKELYQKYHSKGFEILGVTNDTNHKAWTKAIKSDEIPWLNVADKFPEKSAPAVVISKYGMDYLPSTVLVDKDGIIISKLLHGDELDEKLKEIFGF